MQDVSHDIIRQCQNGSAEEFATVVEMYERPVFSYVYKILCRTPKSGEVEDVVQEIFIKAYANIKSFRSGQGTKFSNWLFTIARNHCLSLLRKRGIATQSMDDGKTGASSMADPRSANPREAALEKELAGKVAEAISRLPENQRSAFLLMYYEDLPYDDIACIMDCSVGTVKSRIFRARAALGESLKEYVSI